MTSIYYRQDQPDWLVGSGCAAWWGAGKGGVVARKGYHTTTSTPRTELLSPERERSDFRGRRGVLGDFGKFHKTFRRTRGVIFLVCDTCAVGV